jgi:hypothetical protein
MSRKDEASSAAKALSKRGASKGGRARANVLDEEERREIASKAGKARWAKKRAEEGAEEAAVEPVEIVDDRAPSVPLGPDKLPFSAFPGTLMMGSLELECHVLDDGRRVLTGSEIVRALRGTKSKPASVQRYFDGMPNFAPGMFDDRMMHFRIPNNPTTALGFEATVLIDICDLYIAADEAGTLKSNQRGLVRQSWTIMRASSKVGIEALIDEATGYQEVREKRALQVKLQAFIAEDMQKWVKTFPDEFWHELARLEGIRYQARHRPLRWGNYVLKFVYRAMDEDVAAELKKRTPNPHYKQNLHQHLRDFGKDQLQRQLGGVIAIMRQCNDMSEFRARFETVYEKQGQGRLGDFDWDKLLPAG